MENKELFELTNPQKNIWNTEQFYKGSTIGNLVGTLIIDEPVNFVLLKKAINIVIKNNDGLRLRLLLAHNTVRQYISSYNPIDFEILELPTIGSLKDVENNIVNISFNIINTNLFEFTIFKFADGHGGFITKLHHIIGDAWTMSLLANQIITNYSNLLNNKKIEDTSYSYIDFINSEKDYLSSYKFKKSKEFWNSEFDTLSPSYITESDSKSFLAKRLSYSLDKDFCMEISDFCEKHKTSPYSIFMSVLSIYLSKINHVIDPIVGTPVLNRNNFREKNTMGMFISTVPFKSHIEYENTYISFLEDFSKKEFAIFRNQKYPYNILLNDVRKKFNISRNIYDVALSYQNAKNNSSTSDVKYHTRWIFNNTVSNNLDIHIYDSDNTGILSLSYDYKTELFKEIDIVLLHKRLISLLRQVLDNPTILIKDLKIISEEEENYIFNIYNNTNSQSSNNVPVIALFREQVKMNPSSLAICDANICYTYKELDNLSNHLANILLEKGVQKGDKVCLFFENSIELIVSILATLKVGGCYIPIDIKHPIDRVKYVLKNSSSKLILSNLNNIHLLNDLNDDKMLVNLENLDINYENAIDISQITSTDLAYIIYTSGSTGKPKGVAISNKSLSNYINFCKKQYVANERTNFPLYSSIAFDLTVTSIYTPLTTGNTIYIYRNENPQLLLKSIIDDKKVHIIKLTPAHLSLLYDIDCSQSIVTKLIVGGDILPVDVCKKISYNFSHTLHIYNEYGPTEATVGCMIYEYSEKDSIYTSIPIGKPIGNVKIYLLDKNLSPVPCGTLGEMYIGGDCLSTGYIGLDDINKNSFIKSPFDNNSILYKTGDLAKLYYNDTMEYFGRSDFQVKINGFRIEIGEIQSNLLKHDDIKDCYVTAVNIDNQKMLCAYYISDKELSNLDMFLSNSLPIYMIPKHFIRLEEFPLTVNGKINKSLLPLPELKTQTYEAPQNELEDLLQNIFMQLLNTDIKISVTTNIFEYYIDSLILIKAQTILYSKGIDINTQVFYEHNTIRDLANYIMNHTDSNFYNNTYPVISEIAKPITDTFSYDNILMFGATGFLGIHILYNLLEKTNSKIYCIIREKNNISPYERLKNKFLFYFSNDIFLKYQKRIHIINGNLLQDNFGLSLEEYNNLSKTIDIVIDTAAIVKHYGNYDSFLETNVNGTKRIIKFCKTSNIPFHYISTLSVSGYGLVSTPMNATFDETNLYIGQKYKDNVYVRSKFEAEKLILNECKNGLIASIYRIGNITNRFSDGLFQENSQENAFLNRLIGFISLGIIPNEILNFNFEFTPVDICANFIVSLLKCQDKNLKIYHLFNSNFLSGKTLVDFINTTIYQIECLSFEEFKNILTSSNKQYFGIINYINNIQNEDTITLKNDITALDLEKQNLSWPEINKDYIMKIINYMEDNDLIGGNTNEIKK